MKTVKGTVLSTKPISLSKAASILSKFVSAETGASQAVCAYLRRASLAFNELSQLHKEVKPHRSKHRTLKWKTHAGDEDPARSAVSSQPELTQELSHGIGKDSAMEREEKKNKKKSGEIENLEEKKGKLGIEKDGNLGVENERRKKEKKQKKGRMEIDENGDVEIEDERKKQKKKREKSRGQMGIENGDGDVVEEEERRRKKKRKSGEIEDRLETNSEELHSKKKKKRKSEG